jgi:hypothetical protein
MNRKPLASNGSAKTATGMFTRIARQTCREWFFDARIAGHVFKGMAFHALKIQ